MDKFKAIIKTLSYDKLVDLQYCFLVMKDKNSDAINMLNAITDELNKREF